MHDMSQTAEAHWSRHNQLEITSLHSAEVTMRSIPFMKPAEVALMLAPSYIRKVGAKSHAPQKKHDKERSAAHLQQDRCGLGVSRCHMTHFKFR